MNVRATIAVSPVAPGAAGWRPRKSSSCVFTPSLGATTQTRPAAHASCGRRRRDPNRADAVVVLRLPATNLRALPISAAAGSLWLPDFQGRPAAARRRPGPAAPPERASRAAALQTVRVIESALCSGDHAMPKASLCDLLGIDVPIILAPMGSCTSAELAAAASNEGALGSIGTLFRTTAAITRDIDVVKTLTKRPYAVNHIPQTLEAEAFRHTLEARPAVISFALGDPGDLVRQAHAVGSLVMVQVTTTAQAVQAAERGADVIIAQGGEAGGYGGEVSTMALVPQVVDAVSP